MVGLEVILRHKPQRAFTDLSRDNPHRVGGENLNILYGSKIAINE